MGTSTKAGMDWLELLVMVNAGARVAEAAVARYNEKVKKITEGKSSIGRIAGYATEQDRQWQGIGAYGCQRPLL